MKATDFVFAAAFGVALVVSASWVEAGPVDDVREALRDKDFERALKLVAPLTQKPSASPEVLELYARALHQNGRIEKALEIWTRLLATTPDNDVAARAVDKATDLLKRAKARVRFLESMIEEKRSVTGDCRDLLRAYHPISSRSKIRLILAKSLLLDGKLDEAIVEATELRQEYEGQIVGDEAWILLAMVYSRKPEKRERALKTIDGFLGRKTPQGRESIRIQAEMEKARILRGLGRITEALGIYQELTKGKLPPKLESVMLSDAADAYTERAAHNLAHAGSKPGAIDPMIVKAAESMKRLIDAHPLSKQTGGIPDVARKAYQPYFNALAFDLGREALQLFEFPNLPSKTADDLTLKLATSYLEETEARIAVLKNAGLEIPTEQIAQEEEGLRRLLELSANGKTAYLRTSARARILTWGRLCGNEKRHSSALYVFSEFIKKLPASAIAAEALLARGEVYLAMPSKPYQLESMKLMPLHQKAWSDLAKVMTDYRTTEQAGQASQLMIMLMGNHRESGRLELTATLYRDFIRLCPDYKKLKQMRINLAEVLIQLGVKEAKRLEAQARAEDNKKLLGAFQEAVKNFADASVDEFPEAVIQNAALKGIDAITTHYQAIGETKTALVVLDLMIKKVQAHSLKQSLQLRKWNLLFERGKLDISLHKRNAAEKKNPIDWHKQSIELLMKLHVAKPRLREKDILGHLAKLAEVYSTRKEYEAAALVYGLALAGEGDLKRVEGGVRYQRIVWLKAAAELARSQSLDQRLNQDELQLSNEFTVMLTEVDALVTDLPKSSWSLKAFDLAAGTAQYYMDRKSWKVARGILSGFVIGHEKFDGAAQATYLLARSFKHEADAKSFRDPESDALAPLNQLYGKALQEYQSFLTKYKKEDLINKAFKDMFSIAELHEQKGFWNASADVYRFVLSKNPDNLFGNWLRYQAGLSNAASVLSHTEILLEKKATPSDAVLSGHGPLRESKLKLKGKRNARAPIPLVPVNLAAGWSEGLDLARIVHGPQGEVITYVVKQGDNLSTICEKVLGNAHIHQEIAKTNRLRNPEKLEVGQVLTLRKDGSVSVPLPSDVELVEVNRARMMSAVDAFIGILIKDPVSDRLKPKAEAALLRTVLMLRDRNLWSEAADLYAHILQRLPEHKQRETFELQRAYSLANAARVFKLKEENVGEYDAIYENARKAFGDFVKRFPESKHLAEARQVLQSTFLHQGRVLKPVDRAHAASRLLRGLESLRANGRDLQDTVVLWLEIAKELELCKAYEDAVDAYLDHARTFPVSENAPESFLNAARILGDHLKNKMRAILAFQEYHHSTGTSEDVVSKNIYDLCVGFQNEKNWVAAASAYNLFISNFPRHPLADDALRNIGNINKNTELWQDALDIYDRFLDDYPASELLPSVKMSRAECFENLSQWDAAIKIYEEFVDAGQPVAFQLGGSLAFGNNNNQITIMNPSIQVNTTAPGQVSANAPDPQPANPPLVPDQAPREEAQQNAPQQTANSQSAVQVKVPAQFVEVENTGAQQAGPVVTPQQLKERILILKDISRFQELIDNYKDNDKLDEAQFEIAEIVMKKLGNKVKAIQEFRKVVVKHAKSYKADDAQFMVGRLLLDLERFGEARDEMLLVVKQYPDSPFSDDALFHHAWSFEREAEIEEGLTSEERIRRVIEKGQKARYLKRARKR